MISAGIFAVIQAITGIAGEFIEDPDKRNEFKARLLEKTMDRDSSLFKAQASIINSEAQGESWMQRNWRPLTMLVFTFIIANNYILVPYIMWFFPTGTPPPQLALPPDMWTLMKIGLGGYVTGRSAEKIAKVMTGKGIIERVTGK
jgi:hypothetical protein